MTTQLYLDSLQLTQHHNSVAQLNEIIAKHLATYSFSSINAMKADILSLDPEALIERLVLKKQGGYCFEQNKLAYLALQSLGYNVTPLLARVKLNNNPSNARTHRLTMVELAGERYLFDVGFGSKCPAGLIPISQSGMVTLNTHQYKVTVTEQNVEVALVEPELLVLYSADFIEILESDCNVAHFYSHQHPDSGFVQHLVLSRRLLGKCYTLRNLLFKEQVFSPQLSHERILQSGEELRTVIRDIFNITITSDDAERLFERAKRNMR
ncbi:arylamine N-acetyltransferase [Pseudoalteromonas fenneropenaei]|uniref:Arylamine N-acetyltransferase n=1 Tax=Pseudoalteromonas fenneropenaei TaxID=1737459 RepID=A0ABV7CM97_9GAMM